MRNAFHILQGDHLVCQKPQRPAFPPFRSFAARQSNQVCFGLTIQPALILPFWFLAVKRRFQASLDERLACG